MRADPWALLDIREGTAYGRIVSRHATREEADEAWSTSVESDIGVGIAATHNALPALMWMVVEVSGAIGDRVRWRP